MKTKYNRSENIGDASFWSGPRVPFKPVVLTQQQQDFKLVKTPEDMEAYNLKYPVKTISESDKAWNL